MGNTPDRFPGPLQDEEIWLEETAIDPSVLGAIKYVSGSFRLKDGIGVFDPRSVAAIPLIYYGENLAPYTTTSGSFQQAWRYTSPSLLLGNYLVFVGANVGVHTDGAGAAFESRAQLNDGTVLATTLLKPNVAIARVSMFSLVRLNAISGIQNIDFDIRKVSGNGSVAIDSERVFLWKVS